MHLKISHLTRYDYDRPVSLRPHLLYLRPRENPLLQVERFAFSFQPAARLNWMRDDFDNLPASVHFTTDSDHLEIRSECVVTTADVTPFDFLMRDYAVEFPFAYEPLHRFNLTIYLAPAVDAETQRAIVSWLDAHFQNRPRETVAWLSALNQAIHAHLGYRRRDEPGIQPALATIENGTGSCRDFAMLFIECARTCGLAVRFVSGYLFDPDETGSSAMHAWVEVFLPGAGWIGLDPTHGIFCHNCHVPVAHAVVAESVNPVQGSFHSPGPVTARMTTDMRMRRF